MAKKVATRRKRREGPVVRSDGKPTREERSAARRAAAQALRDAMRDPRGSTPPRATRPFTNDDFKFVLVAIAMGGTGTGACRELGVSMQQFLYHIDKTDCAPDLPGERRRLYGQARVHQAEVWGDNLVDIADEEIIGDPMFPGSLSAEVAHRTLRINTRRWLMGKYHIGFADRTTVDHTGSVGVEVRDEEPIKTVEELREKIKTRRIPIDQIFPPVDLIEGPAPVRRQRISVERE